VDLGHDLGLDLTGDLTTDERGEFVHGHLSGDGQFGSDGDHQVGLDGLRLSKE
jgi:hypothetical protein